MIMIQRLKMNPSPQTAAKSQNLTARGRIFTLIFWQFVVVILVAGILSLSGFNRLAYSLLLGSLTCIIPASCFALTFFAYSGARAARQIVRSFYRAELLKWLLTAILFALVFKYIPVEPVTYFVSFIGTQTLFWLLPLLQR